MKKPSRGKRNSPRSPRHAAPVSKPATVSHQSTRITPAAPADISPAIAFLLGLKVSPAPARRPPNRPASRTAVASAPPFSQDDRATLALLTLPILLIICGLAITQSLKPLRRVDIAAASATVIPPAVHAPKPVLAPSATPQIPLTPAAITPSTPPRIEGLAVANPALMPAHRSDAVPSTPSPALAATPAPATAANERTAMLTSRPPLDLDASPSAALLRPIPSQPIPSQEGSLDTEPKLCTARPITSPVNLTTAALTPAAFGMALAAAASAQIHDLVIYNDKYRALSYPRGDVQPLYGVCTDVIIRAYRALGVDLQQLVHDSRIGNGDTSIDHRRTETLRRFFTRAGQQLAATTIAEDYLPGDIVTYDRPQNRGSRSHIALVSDVIAPSGRYMIVHNRGWGPQLEDALFVDAITGHYRYSAPAAAPLLANVPVISTPQKRPSSLTRLASRAVRRLDGTSVNGLGR